MYQLNHKVICSITWVNDVVVEGAFWRYFKVPNVGEFKGDSEKVVKSDIFDWQCLHTHPPHKPPHTPTQNCCLYGFMEK